MATRKSLCILWSVCTQKKIHISIKIYKLNLSKERTDKPHADSENEVKRLASIMTEGRNHNPRQSQFKNQVAHENKKYRGDIQNENENSQAGI